MTPHVTFYLTLKIFVPQTLFFISAPFLVGGGGVVDGHGAAGGGKLIEIQTQLPAEKSRWLARFRGALVAPWGGTWPSGCSLGGLTSSAVSSLTAVWAS